MIAPVVTRYARPPRPLSIVAPPVRVPMTAAVLVWLAAMLVGACAGVGLVGLASHSPTTAPAPTAVARSSVIVFEPAEGSVIEVSR